MTEPPEYGRYRQDERVLAEVGRWLRDAGSLVKLPTKLADAALAAWRRDEPEGVQAETDEQRRVRSAAATLALIGLAVENARQHGTDLTLHPETVAEAVAAADRE